MFARCCLACGLVLVTLAPSCSQKKEELPKKESDAKPISKSREFPVREVKPVMRCVLNALQEEGFVVKNLSVELGFLTAVKEVDIGDKRANLWAQFTQGKDARFPKERRTDVTCTINPTPTGVCVRLQFQSKEFDNKGALLSIKNAEEDAFYNRIFEKIDEEFVSKDATPPQ